MCVIFFLLHIVQICKVFVANTNKANPFSVLSFRTSQYNSNRDRAKAPRDGDRRDVDSGTAHVEAAPKDTRVNLGPLPNRKLDKYDRECAGMVVVKRFGTMAVDVKNPVIQGRLALSAIPH